MMYVKGKQNITDVEMVVDNIKPMLKDKRDTEGSIQTDSDEHYTTENSD
jgi:hypothetical protein